MLVIAVVENFLTPWEQFQQSQYSIHDRARENAERKHKMSGENTNSNLTDSSMVDLTDVDGTHTTGRVMGSVDSDADGKTDTYSVDTDGDGFADAQVVDSNEDGKVDSIDYDTTRMVSSTPTCKITTTTAA